MRCPFCGHQEDKVVDSRSANDGHSIRRRRECLSCTKRFTTYEQLEEIPLMVVKKGGTRELFDRPKIINGILKACEKRPVTAQTVYEAVDQIEYHIRKEYEKEVDSVVIGELIIERLKNIDKVAYVRFASVYKEFKDVNEFIAELKHILT